MLALKQKAPHYQPHQPFLNIWVGGGELRQGLPVPPTGLELTIQTSWPQSHRDLPASSSRVLGLKLWDPTPEIPQHSYLLIKY